MLLLSSGTIVSGSLLPAVIGASNQIACFDEPYQRRLWPKGRGNFPAAPYHAPVLGRCRPCMRTDTEFLLLPLLCWVVFSAQARQRLDDNRTTPATNAIRSSHADACSNSNSQAPKNCMDGGTMTTCGAGGGTPMSMLMSACAN